MRANLDPGCVVVTHGAQGPCSGKGSFVGLYAGYGTIRSEACLKGCALVVGEGVLDLHNTACHRLVQGKIAAVREGQNLYLAGQVEPSGLKGHVYGLLSQDVAGIVQDKA